MSVSLSKMSAADRQIVCDWWHGYPQLFFRIKYYTTPAPASCADVYLKPVYL